jgi:putative PLP-dependent aminotransferase (TIGR04422 family)
MTGYFLWPEPKASRAIKSLYRSVPVPVIEGLLREMFPTGFPVLFSSGRAALAISLIYNRKGRGDLVGVFPYASHCVLDAVSRTATPLSGPTAINASLRLVYHQWGFVQETELPKNSIEDCVDTLCVPGTALFPGGGRFEIWSLPKILGTTSGGVLWCRDQDTVDAIKIARDARGGGLLPWAIRLIGTSNRQAQLYWQGAEPALGCMSRFQTGEIVDALESWDKVVTDRLKKLDLVWKYAFGTLRRPVNRLPPVIPVLSDLPEQEIRGLGISTGYRTFEQIHPDGARSLAKVIPIPIHQDVPTVWLSNCLHYLNRKVH